MPDTIFSANDALPITPADATVLNPVPRAIYVGGTGDIKVDMNGGETTVTFKAVPTGTILPIRPTRVYAATTATNLVGLF